MKKLIKLLSLSILTMAILSSCVNNVPSEPEDPIYANGVKEITIGDFTITAKGDTDRIYKSSYNELILISKVDVDVLNEDGTKPDAPEYDLAGTFNGQIINKTKGSILNLRGVTLTNTAAPAIYGEKKIEISAKKDGENTITVTDTSEDKVAAVYCKKGIEIGGSGKLNVNCSIFHGIKGGDVKLKGSLTLTINGANDSGVLTDGSAINCDTFLVEEGKTFKATFKNFKHGVKADKTIDIASGNFTMDSSIVVPFKTEKTETDGQEGHYIKVLKSAVNFQGGDEQINQIQSDYVDLYSPVEPA